MNEQENTSPRRMSPSEYAAFTRKLDEEALAKVKEREDAAAAKEKAAAEYLESMPPVAEIFASDPHTLLTQVIHRIRQGYAIEDDGIKSFSSWLYHVQLTLPVTSTGKSKTK
ncbi:hypothetical protein [Cupriavidus necator]|uniref:Uncharacterized protein n=1 Tax=Cupriavidus pinatubonensis (strain JMP 134 / LMG 1197) TaxID=264198 RepID=Q46W13_CUPPJ|nr:hypothetical protein [Cupriavidus necator]